MLGGCLFKSMVPNTKSYCTPKYILYMHWRLSNLLNNSSDRSTFSNTSPAILIQFLVSVNWIICTNSKRHEFLKPLSDWEPKMASFCSLSHYASKLINLLTDWLRRGLRHTRRFIRCMISANHHRKIDSI